MKPLIVESNPRDHDFRVYEKQGDDHFIATSRIYQYCDTGIVSNMLGQGLLSGLAQHLPTMHRDYGMTRYEGYVLQDIARACKIIGRRYGLLFEEGRHCRYMGRDFVWVTLRLPEVS